MEKIEQKFQSLCDIIKSYEAEGKSFNVNLYGTIGYKRIVDYMGNCAQAFMEFLAEHEGEKV